MKRTRSRGVLLFAGLWLFAVSSASAGEHIIAGVEAGVTGATSPLKSYVNNGASIAPFGGFMWNEYLGVMGQLHVLALPTQDRRLSSTGEVIVGVPTNDPRYATSINIVDDDVSWALGGTVGPRLALPVGGIEFYATFQLGMFTGLSGAGAITDTSWAFSTGGGMTLPITDRVALGAFGRFNRLYQRVHGEGDAEYGTGGLNLTVKFDVPQFVYAPPAK